jgi:hypothetical protein
MDIFHMDNTNHDTYNCGADNNMHVDNEEPFELSTEICVACSSSTCLLASLI